MSVDAFWIGVGDLHGDARNAVRIPEVKDAGGIIVAGDITTHGDVNEARQVLDDLKAANPAVLAQIGNMDSKAVTALLDDEGINIHLSARELAPGAGLVGVGWSAPTPFGTACEVPDETIGRWLSEVHALTRDWEQWLLVVHTPPQGTRVDDLGGGRHVGSPAVRSFIELARPAACLTGHIHEGRSSDKLAGTTVVNPGMLAHGGYALITLTDGKLGIELKNI